MEPIKEGLTWRQIQNLFDTDDEFSMSIQPHLRRLKPWKRKKGEKDDRTVVRLIVQRRQDAQTKTVLRKNLRNLDKDYLDTQADPKVVENINGILATLVPVQ